MTNELIDKLIEDLRSRLQSTTSKNFEIDIYVKDGESFLIFTPDSYTSEFMRRLP